MKQALGLVGISGLSIAVVVADTMAKAANVRIPEIEDTRGLGYMTIKVIGDVDAVSAVVNAGKQIGTANGELVSWKVIPRLSDYVDQTFCCPEPPVPPFPPREEAQEETEVEAKVKAGTMEVVKAGGPEETGLEEIAPEDTEQKTEAEPAEARSEPRIGAEPTEIKSEPLAETEPTRTGTVGLAGLEVPDPLETPPERPKKAAKCTTSAESASIIRHKRN